jgi:uncharacterized protein (DUF697 family)
VFGKTGAGKSTLINAVFGEDVAPTGIGEPVTKGKHLYLHREGFFGLLDTQGLEIGQDTDEIIKELDEYVSQMRKEPLSEQIHVAWYCVRASDRRFEDTEAEFVRRLHALGLPVVLVMTQVLSRDGEIQGDAIEFAAHIAGLGLPIEAGRPVLVMAVGDRFMGQQHGLKDLVDATFRVAPEGVEKALAAAQKVDLSIKQKRANAAIAAAGIAAGAVGVAPIPIADASILVPLQLGLMARITAIYGVRIEIASVAATAATDLGKAAGRAVAVGLLKLITGASTLIGGVIGGATATTFTLAMGYAWSAVCTQIAQGRLLGLEGAIDADAVKKFFTEEFTTWLKNPTNRRNAQSVAESRD